RRRGRVDDFGIVEQDDVSMRLFLSSSDEGHHAVRGARLAQAQHAHWTGVAAGARILPVRKGGLKSGFRTRPVGHSREPEIARGSKPKLGAVISSDLLVVVSRGQEEVLRRWLDCLAVNHKARPPAATALGSPWVTPILQRWGWPALSSLVREPSG